MTIVSAEGSSWLTEPEHRVYAPGKRPHVEVMVHGRWLTGELRMWTQRPDDSWWGTVAYLLGGETTRRQGTFPAHRIRHLESRDEPARSGRPDPPPPGASRPTPRPTVRIKVDDAWYDGCLISWSRGPDDRWWGHVRWSPSNGEAPRLGTFPPDRIRGATPLDHEKVRQSGDQDNLEALLRGFPADPPP